MKLWASGLLLAAIVFIGFTGTSTEQDQQRAGWPNRSELRSVMQKTRQIAIVYPDGKEYAPYAERVKTTRSRYYSVTAYPARDYALINGNESLRLIGTVESNPRLAELAAGLPLSLAKSSFTINKATYNASSDILRITLPHPENPWRHLEIITGNNDKSIIEYLDNQPRRSRTIGDYTVFRSGQVAAYGFLHQPTPGAPWAIQAEAETNFIKQKERVVQNEYFVVDWSRKPEHATAGTVEAFFRRQQQLVDRQLLQLKASESVRAAILPIHVTLYATAEDKAIATRDSRFSSWVPGDSSVNIVFDTVVQGDDFTAIAEYIAWHWAGEIPNLKIRQAAGILFSENWGREGFSVLAGRLFNNGSFISLLDALQNDSRTGVSKYIVGAELASFLQFVIARDGTEGLRRILKTTPETLTNENFSTIFSTSLIADWEKWCSATLVGTKPDAIVADASFQKGFCFAHQGYSIYNGYLGETSRTSVHRLSQLGVNAISITPFGYIRHIDKPAAFYRSEGLGTENDESLLVSANFARQKGMRVMLKPHIWTGSGTWPGDIKMKDEKDWPAFFANYKQWITHYAILAQIHKFESFVIGLEMVQATIGHEDEWRKLVKHARTIYAGKIIYAANWGREIEELTFWDAMDAIGIDSYYPLADNNSPDDNELLKKAQKIAATFEKLSKKYNRKVILTEIGFSSRTRTWKNPYKDGRGEKIDLAAQKRCYEVTFKAFYHQPWLDGIYWWKWPTSLDIGGHSHTGFTPNQKPAEEVVSKWFSTPRAPD